jgi:hypothetical protein
MHWILAVGFQVPGGHSSGESGAATSTVRASTQREAGKSQTDRPNLWSFLAKVWSDWKQALIFVKPETVIRWQRKRFREHWKRLSRSGEPGRPSVPNEVKELILTMSSMNPTWGSPRIVGELAKVATVIAKSTIEKCMVRARKPPSPAWRAFLKRHTKDIVSIDFLVVPTVHFKILYVFLFLSVERAVSFTSA